MKNHLNICLKTKFQYPLISFKKLNSKKITSNDSDNSEKKRVQLIKKTLVSVS